MALLTITYAAMNGTAAVNGRPYKSPFTAASFLLSHALTSAYADTQQARRGLSGPVADIDIFDPQHINCMEGTAGLVVIPAG